MIYDSALLEFFLWEQIVLKRLLSNRWLCEWLESKKRVGFKCPKVKEKNWIYASIADCVLTLKATKSKAIDEITNSLKKFVETPKQITSEWET